MALFDRTSPFEREVRPHLKSAYNLARWLTRNESDAEDALQEALLRAYRHFDDVHSDDVRGWFLQIVRNTSYSWLKKHRGHVSVGDEKIDEVCDPGPDPEARILSGEAVLRVRAAMEMLPAEFREVLILREFNDLSYGEIARITGLAEGTVMSRLSRARNKLRIILAADGKGESR